MAAQFGTVLEQPASFLLAGVRVVDPATGTDDFRDLAVAAGRIADPQALPSDAPRIDGSGLVAAPGFCDLHTHLREPGAEGSETIQTGALAAAHGGFTTICAMPNTDPALDEPARVARVARRAEAVAARVRVIGCATRGRAGEALTDAAALAAEGVVAVSDDGAAIPTARLARSAMQSLAAIGLPLIEHAEEPTLADGALMRDGAIATRLGLAGWPVSTEITLVQRDIALAEETGAWLHLTHLSTAGSVEAVRRAKERGVRVTCDVTPHHVSMTDAWVAGDRAFAWAEPGPVAQDPFGSALDPERAYDGACRVNPPLPGRDDAIALLRGVADGTVDAIATDHAPHPPEHKKVEFAAASPGMIGLETALSLGLVAVDAGCLSLQQLLAAISTRPARIIGEERGLAEGQVADLVVFDPAQSWRVEPSVLASRSSNTPLLGMELPGVVRLTVASGRVTYREGLVPLG
jgi:dihydroorotase